jgi:hypothetical protein
MGHQPRKRLLPGGQPPGRQLISRQLAPVAVLAGGACAPRGALAAGAAGADSGPAGGLGTQGRLAVLYLFFGGLLGVGRSIAHAAALIGVQAFFSRRRGLATGLTVAGSGVGAFVMGPVCESLIVASSWSTALALLGGAAAAICLAAAVVLGARAHCASGCPGRGAGGTPCPRGDEGGQAARAPGPLQPPPPAVGGGGGAASPRTYRALVQTPFARGFGLFIALFALCWFTVPTFLPSFVKRGLGGSSVDAGAVVATQGAANAVGRVLMGLAADKWPRHKRELLTGCMTVVAVLAAALAGAPSLWLAYLLRPASAASGLGHLHAAAAGSRGAGPPRAAAGHRLLQRPAGALCAGGRTHWERAGGGRGDAGWAGARAYSALWAFVAATFGAAAVATRGIVTERAAQRRPAPVELLETPVELQETPVELPETPIEETAALEKA